VLHLSVDTTTHGNEIYTITWELYKELDIGLDFSSQTKVLRLWYSYLLNIDFDLMCFNMWMTAYFLNGRPLFNFDICLPFI